MANGLEDRDVDGLVGRIRDKAVLLYAAWMLIALTAFAWATRAQIGH
jgi:hypothetical protein